jgi:hypothetical protein
MGLSLGGATCSSCSASRTSRWRGTEGGQVVVGLRGVDVYDLTTGEGRSSDTSQIAVKVINDYGDEVMKVFNV